ncbi:uncharacterized protein LOC126304765 isoform X2 [Schistocerca gregaria]|uniref:uncharacterized protein LOC126304765 isoform X2 n=1 Tax=Schistocerca gregaria TaxID=7010 RepID=UPI00211F1546|nr:uncharacterized protein LOC126304765 isoform X2 [Schistocerca gregaria]
MNPLLQWGIENSDLDALRASAEKLKEEGTVSRLDKSEILNVILESDGERLKKYLSRLPPSFSREERLEALKGLQYLTEDIDNAILLDQQEGSISSLQSLLEERDPAIQSHAAWVLATCLQNNPSFVSSFVVGHNGLKQLIKCTFDTDDSEVRAKLLSVLCGCLQSLDGVLDTFLELDGCSLLEYVLELEGDWTSKRKLAFKIGRMSLENAEFAELVGKRKILDSLVRMALQGDDVDAQEQALRAIREIVRRRPSTRGVLDERGLRQSLVELAAEMKNHEWRSWVDEIVGRG